MGSTESTSIAQVPADDAVFSVETREQALSVLEKHHGGLAATTVAPVRNVIDWVLGKQMNAQVAANIIEAHNRFNQVANDATYGSEKKKAA